MASILILLCVLCWTYGDSIPWLDNTLKSIGNNKYFVEISSKLSLFSRVIVELIVAPFEIAGILLVGILQIAILVVFAFWWLIIILVIVF